MRPSLVSDESCTVAEPYALFARRGILDMLQHGDDSSVAEAVPLLIAPLRGVPSLSPYLQMRWQLHFLLCCSCIANRRCSNLCHDSGVLASNSQSNSDAYLTCLTRSWACCLTSDGTGRGKISASNASLPQKHPSLSPTPIAESEM